jgi:hypothetical protein
MHIMRTNLFVSIAAIVACTWLSATSAIGQQPAAERSVDSSGAPPAPLAPPTPAGAIRLAPDQAIWVDRERREVILGGSVCLRAGYLEMFACPIKTKEHESIIAIAGTAQLTHAALLVVGAQVGKPVQFRPDYSPAEGSVIDIRVRWMDVNGRFQEVRAQDWIRNVRTREPMEHSWVFAGSGFRTSELDGSQFYLADAGELICVSNFSSAMLDLPIESPEDNAALLYEAYTERIPAFDTPVQIILSPRVDAPAP